MALILDWAARLRMLLMFSLRVDKKMAQQSKRSNEHRKITISASISNTYLPGNTEFCVLIAEMDAEALVSA